MKYLLLYDYIRLSGKLEYLSRGDAAALRCLKRKYEELRDDLRVTYKDAQIQLIQEYNDCLPVDE